MKDNRFKWIAFGAGLAGSAALSAYVLAVRPRNMRWGATNARSSAPWPAMTWSRTLST